MTAQYVAGFAEAYDRFWHPYPTKAAAQLLRLHQAVAPDGERRLLDVGCGTGIVAEQFLAAGYEVTGLDCAEGMLSRARERLDGHHAENLTLRCADATDFDVAETFPFAVSTYDIPNHLRDVAQVRRYLERMYAAVSPGGLFAFDMATMTGLRGMNQMQVRDTDDGILLFRGALDEDRGAGSYRISGVVEAPDGRYDRFATTITNIVVPVDDTLDAMKDIGWVDCHLAAPDDLLTPLTDVPTSLPRLYVIAHKP